MILINTNKAPVIVIGMHRTGTSLLSRILHEVGIFMGNDQSKHNESLFFYRINESMLHERGASWIKPVIISNAKPEYNASLFYRNYLGIKTNTTRLAALRDYEWGWKDPRNSFTLPFWMSIYPNAKVIHIHRNGVSVALSLMRRNYVCFARPNKMGYEPELKDFRFCLDLWEQYTRQSIRNEEIAPRYSQIRYEDLVTIDSATVDGLGNFLGRDVNSVVSSQVTPSKAHPNFALEDEWAEAAKANQLIQELGYGI